jgi:hypothetical protein
LGDSFTAGYRIDQKNTFCYLLEDTLKKIIPRKEIEVLPVWVNDPVLGAYYMQKYIEVLNPDLVFYGICLSNDVFQAFFKMSSVGGAFNVNLDSMYVSKIERNNILLSKIENQLNSTTFDNECLNYQNFSFWLITKNRLKNYILNITGKFKSLFFIKNLILSRPGQAIFNYSSYTRPSIFDTNNGLGLFLKNQPSVIDTAYNHFFSALTFQNNLCKRLNIPYFTILYGQRFQVQPKDWQATLIQYQLNENCFDLKLPNRKMKQQFEKNNITFFDPTDTFIQKHKLNKKNLYLPMGDMHWNEEGNRVMADYLLPIILSNVSTK